MHSQLNFLLPIASVAFVGLVSLLAVYFLKRASHILQRSLPLLTAMGAGALLGDSIGHLLPGSLLGTVGHHRTAIIFVAVILLLSVAESKNQNSRTLAIIVSGNYLHNFVDGVLIGSSFLAGERSGLLSTFAILLHEIPHELGVFGIMVDEGMSAFRAVTANAVSAFLAIAGTIIALLLGKLSGQYATFAEPCVAGLFVYIACTDLLPDISQHPLALRISQVAIAFASALLLIILG